MFLIKKENVLSDSSLQFLICLFLIRGDLLYNEHLLTSINRVKQRGFASLWQSQTFHEIRIQQVDHPIRFVEFNTFKMSNFFELT